MRRRAISAALHARRRASTSPRPRRRPPRARRPSPRRPFCERACRSARGRVLASAGHAHHSATAIERVGGDARRPCERPRRARRRKRALGRHSETPAPSSAGGTREAGSVRRRVGGEVGARHVAAQQERRLESDEAQPHDTRPRDAAERRVPKGAVERLSLSARPAATVKRCVRLAAVRRRPRVAPRRRTPSRRLPVSAHPARRFEARGGAASRARLLYSSAGRRSPRKLPGGRSPGARESVGPGARRVADQRGVRVVEVAEAYRVASVPLRNYVTAARLCVGVYATT